MIGKKYETLLVDDDKKFQDLIDYNFSNLLNIDAVTTASEAKQKIIDNNYDLILVDLNLDPTNKGELEGFELINRNVTTPIVVVTNNDDVKNYNRAQNLGAKRCLFKSNYEAWRTTLTEVILESKIKSNEEDMTYKALIMKGGGIKGLAYVGAIEELEKQHTFNCFVGTSAGAIAAVLLAVGYSTQELKHIMTSKDFTDFFDARFYNIPFNYIKHKASFRGDSFTNWLENLLAKKLKKATQVKLSELPKRVVVYASTRNKNAIIFDSIKEQSKDFPAAFAVRCSMSIPWVFKAQYVNGVEVYDGGLQHNYPVEIFLRDNPDTNFIGLFLGDEIYKGEAGERSTAGNIYDITIEASSRAALEKYEKDTIVIDVDPISWLQFSLSAFEKDFLIDKGRLSALRFLNHDEAILEQSQIDIEKRRKVLITKKETKQKNRKKTILIAIFIFLISVFSFKYFF